MVAARSAAERREELVALYQRLKDCHDCPLKATRTKLVFGAGNADAEVMFVGEAPGAQEDLEGLPFVGRAGQLLNELLSEIGLRREDVWINNVLMCRPPGNRDPLPHEIEECEPFLLERIRLIQPKVICTLGNFATKLLSGEPTGITRCCGRPQYREIAGLEVVLYPLFHPAAALRTPATKEKLREDMARLPVLIDEQRPKQEAALAEAAEADAEPADADEPETAPQLDLFA